MKDKLVHLQTLCEGAASELFEHELEKVIANILDVKTDATKKRTIELVVTIKPDKNRQHCDVDIACKHKMPARYSDSAEIVVGRRRGKATAFDYDEQQGNLFDNYKPDSNLRPIKGGKDDDD